MSKYNSKKAYVKIYRKLIDWEWYTDVNTSKLFVHCLLRANWCEVDWKGITLKRGQFITSLDILSRETGLSVQEVRTALEHLESTGEITRTSTNKNTLITVASYDKFQGEQQANQQAEQQSNNNQITNNQQQIIINNNNKKEKEEIYSPSAEASAVISEEKSNVDPYGDPPDGWNENWEKHFMMNIEGNPGETRESWYEFCHFEGEENPRW